MEALKGDFWDPVPSKSISCSPFCSPSCDLESTRQMCFMQHASKIVMPSEPWDSRLLVCIHPATGHSLLGRQNLEFDYAYPTPPGQVPGYREVLRHCSGHGKTQPGPAMRPGPWGSQTLGHSGASRSCRRSENRVRVPQVGLRLNTFFQEVMSGKETLLAKPSRLLGMSLAQRTLFWAYMTIGHISFM